MVTGDFADLLKSSMGLDVASIGSSSHRTRRPAAAVGVRDSRIAARTGTTCARATTELQALIEAVVVPETWFFRDREAFTMLARIGHEAWLRRAPASRVLRLLSLPSSTGEEPYSMAMALLDAGIPGGPLSHRRRGYQSPRAHLRRSRGLWEEFISRPGPVISGSPLRSDARRLSPERAPSAGRCTFSRPTCWPPIFCRAGKSTTWCSAAIC